MPTSRFVINGTSYDYQTDIIRIDFDTDEDDYRRLDEVVDTDRREKLAVVTFESVLVAQNANAEGVGASDLYQKIQTEVAAGNAVTFIPDTSISSGYNTNPPEIGVKTKKGGAPRVYETEKGADRLMRSMQLQSDRWLDPTDTTAGGDKETIDDLNDLQSSL